MKFLKIKTEDIPEPNEIFRNVFDEYLDLCEFTLETRLGLLFYMGAKICGSLEIDEFPDPDEVRQLLAVTSLYSKSTADFNDYGDLNDVCFKHWIYNASNVVRKITGNQIEIDKNLRRLPGTDIIVGKTNIDAEFLREFPSFSFNLKSCQNLVDRLFKEFGKHLKESGYDLRKSYEAGYAYFAMVMQIDYSGSRYLFEILNQVMPPLYNAILYSPMLFCFNNAAFYSNSLFSQILNNLHGGENSSNFDVARSVHLYHQFVFYKDKSIRLREEWNFHTYDLKGIAGRVFRSAANIQDYPEYLNKKAIINSGLLYSPELIDLNITYEDFLSRMLILIYEKYGINGSPVFNLGNIKKKSVDWNNKGEFIQFLVILFYEACMHASVLGEIAPNDSRSE